MNQNSKEPEFRLPSPEELRQNFLAANNPHPDIPEILARLGRLQEEIGSAQIRELVTLIGGLCFCVLDVEGEIEELEVKLGQ